MNKSLNMKKGFYFIFGTVLISSFAIFLSKFAVSAVGNSHVFTTGKNLTVALVLSVIVLMPFIYKKFKTISKNDWVKLVLIGVIGGSIPFLLFFKAVSLTASVNAAFIHKTLFVWVSLLAIWFLKEKIGKWQYFALAILFFGNFVLLGFKFISFGYGELLALIATLFWAVEFTIAKKVLNNVDPTIVAWARMFFGSIILLGFLGYIGKLGDLASLNFSQWGWVLLLSVLLTGYVLTWYRGLKYLPASVTASVLVIASPLTTLWNNIFVQHQYLTNQIIGSLLILSGVILIVYLNRQNLEIKSLAYGKD